MKERGQLTPERRAEYRAMLGESREIERRNTRAAGAGGRELQRISRWVLAQWEGDAAKLL